MPFIVLSQPPATDSCYIYGKYQLRWQDPQRFIKLLLQVNFLVPLTWAFFFCEKSLRNIEQLFFFTCLCFKHLPHEKAVRQKTFFNVGNLATGGNISSFSRHKAWSLCCLLSGQLICWRWLVKKLSSGTGQPFTPLLHAGLPYSLGSTSCSMASTSLSC